MRAVASKFLRLQPEQTVGMQCFMMAEKHEPDDDTLACRAILVYALYMATNTFRHSSTCSNTRDAIDAMEQFCRNAVRGHPYSQRLVDNRYREFPTEEGTARRCRRRLE